MARSEVTTAVFPVAGLGTRFLPATKAVAKETLPVVDKPLIQYAVEEAVAAGITKLVFVTGRSKRAIEDHFDRSVELELELEQKGKTRMLEAVRGILPPNVQCVYTRQASPLGLGHAVLCAAPAVGDAPFAVLLPDDMIDSPGKGATAELVEAYEQTHASVVAVQRVPRSHTSRYGIVAVENDDAQVARISGIVEKPRPEAAPSNLGVVGRYVLSPTIFKALANTGRGAGGEIQLTDAIADLVPGEGVYASRFTGVRYDCGDKLGFLQATVQMGRKHPEFGADFDAWLLGPDVGSGQR